MDSLLLGTWRKRYWCTTSIGTPFSLQSQRTQFGARQTCEGIYMECPFALVYQYAKRSKCHQRKCLNVIIVIAILCFASSRLMKNNSCKSTSHKINIVDKHPSPIEGINLLATVNNRLVPAYNEICICNIYKREVNQEIILIKV